MNKAVLEKLENFFSKYKAQKFKKGEFLIKPGDKDPGIFLIKEGSVKQYAVSLNGDELILNIYKPISFFPVGYAINNIVPHHYFEARETVSVYIAPKEQFLEFIKNDPEVLLDLLSRIYYGLEGFFQRMEYLMTGNASGRLVTEILIQAKRFGEKLEKNSIKLKLSEKDLASQAGIARETVSREIHKLIKEDILKFNKSTFIISDINKLEAKLLEI